MNRVIPERLPKMYTVKEGDTLSSIARQQTGSADYSAIYEQNRGLIGDNPNHITPGMVLSIPGDPDAEAEDQEEDEW